MTDNGKKIVSMDYGYLGYAADISGHISYDNDNIVAVYATTKGNCRSFMLIIRYNQILQAEPL